jgi:hypothetical protein
MERAFRALIRFAQRHPNATMLFCGFILLIVPLFMAAMNYAGRNPRLPLELTPLGRFWSMVVTSNAGITVAFFSSLAGLLMIIGSVLSMLVRVVVNPDR